MQPAQVCEAGLFRHRQMILSAWRDLRGVAARNAITNNMSVITKLSSKLTFGPVRRSRAFKSFHCLVIASSEPKAESLRFLTCDVEPACGRTRPIRKRQEDGRRLPMNHSIYSADRTTHLKIVVVALVAGIAGGGLQHLGSHQFGRRLPDRAGHQGRQGRDASPVRTHRWCANDFVEFTRLFTSPPKSPREYVKTPTTPKLALPENARSPRAFSFCAWRFPRCNGAGLPQATLKPAGFQSATQFAEIRVCRIQRAATARQQRAARSRSACRQKPAPRSACRPASRRPARPSPHRSRR